MAIFLDLTKAFDTVSHNILLTKMERIGMRGLPLKLFNNYLTNRKQRCKVDNEVSDENIVLCGVPQGTVLGSTLFLIHINDLLPLEKQIGASIIAYTDDTVLITEGNTWAEVVHSQIMH